MSLLQLSRLNSHDSHISALFIFLSVASNELAGTLPSELCALTSLEHLDLGNQLITGTLPSCFSKLQNLIRFELDDNAVTGSVPYGLLAIPTLKDVEIYANQFDGNLDDLFALPDGFDENSETARGSLRTLKVDRCKLTGSIPTEIGEFTKLYVLGLHDNNLTGDIPTELNELDELQELNLFNNDQLNGEVLEDDNLCDFHDNGNLRKMRLDCNIECECCETCV
jgi:Leucine-rich repeat (LRR) protein